MTTKRTLGLVACGFIGVLMLATAAWAQTTADVSLAIQAGIKARQNFQVDLALSTHTDVWAYCAQQSDPAFAELGVWARTEMGNDLFAAHRYAQAVTELEGAVTQARPWPKRQYDALMGLAKAYERAGRRADAIAALDAGAALTGQAGVGPTERSAAQSRAGTMRVRAAVAQAASGDTAAAKTALAALATTYAGYEGVAAQARFQYACCLVKEGRPFDAMAAFQAVISNHSDNYLAARALERLEELRAQFGSEPSGLVKVWLDGALVIHELN